MPAYDQGCGNTATMFSFFIIHSVPARIIDIAVMKSRKRLATSVIACGIGLVILPLEHLPFLPSPSLRHTPDHTPVIALYWKELLESGCRIGT